MEKTIRVTGKAKIAASPDTIRLTLTSTGENKDYDHCRESSMNANKSIQKAIGKEGIPQKELKTKSYRIETVYERQKKNGTSVSVFMGYQYMHTMSLEISLDNNLLGKILHSLSQLSNPPEIRMAYSIKNPEKVKNKAMAKAIKDSQEKARCLTKAAGVQLGDIIDINYSWDSVEFIHDWNISAPGNVCYGSVIGSADFTPEDINIEDTVTIEWQIR